MTTYLKATSNVLVTFSFRPPLKKTGATITHQEEKKEETVLSGWHSMPLSSMQRFTVTVLNGEKRLTAHLSCHPLLVSLQRAENKHWAKRGKSSIQITALVDQRGFRLVPSFTVVPEGWQGTFERAKSLTPWRGSVEKIQHLCFTPPADQTQSDGEWLVVTTQPKKEKAD